LTAHRTTGCTCAEAVRAHRVGVHSSSERRPEAAAGGSASPVGEHPQTAAWTVAHLVGKSHVAVGHSVVGKSKVVWHSVVGKTHVAVGHSIVGKSHGVWHTIVGKSHVIWHSIAGKSHGVWHSIVGKSEVVWHTIVGIPHVVVWHTIVGIAHVAVWQTVVGITHAVGISHGVWHSPDVEPRAWHSQVGVGPQPEPRRSLVGGVSITLAAATLTEAQQLILPPVVPLVPELLADTCCSNSPQHFP